MFSLLKDREASPDVREAHSVREKNDLVRAWLQRFEATLKVELQSEAMEELFADECFWRDLVSFTWNLKTAEGRGAISEMAAAVRLGACSKNWALKNNAKDDGKGGVEAFLTFETETCNGVGHIRLRPDGRCWTLMTSADSLKCYREPCGSQRVEGRSYGAVRGRIPYSTQKTNEKAQLGSADCEQPFAVIIGGGQCGLAIAARLKRLGVPNIILDKHPRAGDCWRMRYEALHLHDPTFACHLPYLPFPDDWPLWLHKDQMADFLELYVKYLDLNYWAKSECTSAAWDDVAKEWCVQVSCEGSPRTLKPKHLILATGLYGLPFVPDLKGREHFTGEVFHSSAFRGGKKYAGRQAVVVGSNTSAHDIAGDLWEQGANVTMIQRGGTMITHLDTQLKTVFTSEEDSQAQGITPEIGDLMMTTFPFKVFTEMQKERTKMIREKDADYYRRLEGAGFLQEWGEDDSGNVMMFLRRGTGYYFDNGATELVINGDIALRHGGVLGFSRSGSVLLEDGSEIQADVVILATGYRPLNEMAAKIVGEDIAKTLGKVWGLGSSTRDDPGPWEGELRNMWKPTAQEGLWVQGGNLSFSRVYSKYLALQLQARYLGLETPVYGAPGASGGRMVTAAVLGGS